MPRRGKNSKSNSKKEEPHQLSIKFSSHVLQQLSRRFNIDTVDIKRMKRVTQQNSFKFPVLQKKYRTGIHMDTTYLISTAHNLALAIVDGVAITALYLDGRNGYDYLAS